MFVAMQKDIQVLSRFSSHFACTTYCVIFVTTSVKYMSGRFIQNL